MMKYIHLLLLVWIFYLFPFLSHGAEPEPAAEDKVTFAIYSYDIKGNTLLDSGTLIEVLSEFTGFGKTAQDVEWARDALEAAYHETGFPTVLVNIPEQTVEDGKVVLEVIESRIKRVLVTGNKYYTMERIRSELPSVQPGKVLYLPKVREDLARLNSSPDLKVGMVLIPGRELGFINVELKVEDNLPLHGSLELNNRCTHTTTDLRLNGAIHFDNIWQKSHSLNAQFQVSPEDTEEVLLFTGSYALPMPWSQNHMLIGYYVNSDSDTATGEGLSVMGKGQVIGLRYMVMLPGTPAYSQNVIIGLDWKDFEEEIEGVITPIEYMPVSFGYAGTLSDSGGTTQFSAGLNMLFRHNAFSGMEEFTNKREGATGNYIYLTAGMERRQKLPKNFSLFAKLDGQVADQPLVNNEQFSVGGVNSVRGYMESELLGDYAIHSTVEFFGPSLMKNHFIMPYLFYDCAWIGTREPLDGEYGQTFIHGAGIGIHGEWKKIIEFKLDWGMALKDTDDTKQGDQQVHFKVSIKF